MTIRNREIARLERLNYVATIPIAEVTPDLEVCLNDEVITTCNSRFPYPDATHACLFQSSPERVDTLVDEVVDYFKSKALPTNIFLSPACTPGDLGERLLQRGFIESGYEETWLIFEKLSAFGIPPPSPKVTTKQVTVAELLTFIKVMMAAFDIPSDYASYLVSLTEPSMNLPHVRHYMAWIEDRPVGTCTLIYCDGVSTLGGVGVIPSYRRSKVAANLVIQAFKDAQAQGIDTVILQTTAGTQLERLLRINGFKRLFTRTAYSLHE